MLLGEKSNKIKIYFFYMIYEELINIYASYIVVYVWEHDL